MTTTPARQAIDSTDLKYTLRINSQGQSGETLIRFERKTNQGSMLTIQGAVFVFPAVRFSLQKYNLWTASIQLIGEAV